MPCVSIKFARERRHEVVTIALATGVPSFSDVYCLVTLTFFQRTRSGIACFGTASDFLLSMIFFIAAIERRRRARELLLFAGLRRGAILEMSGEGKETWNVMEGAN